MRKLWVSILGLVLLLALSGCIGNMLESHDYSIKSSVGELESLPPKSVVEVGLLKDGKPESSLVKVYLDGELYFEATQTKLTHVFAAKDEGNYKVEVILPDSDVKKELSFKVSALEREVYLDGGRIYYDYLSEELLSPATNLYIRFYKLYEKVMDNGEVVLERRRLNLLDTDGNNIYDTWKILPATATSSDQLWYNIPNPYNLYDTVWQLSYIEYNDEKINLKYTGISGTFAGNTLKVTFAEVGFELNNWYSRYVSTTDFSKVIYDQFMIHERYDSDSKPVFKIVPEKKTVSPGQSLKIFVKAENVADFAKIYDVRYMQFALNHSTMLVLDSVEFPEFMDGLKETGAYNKNDSSVVLYKAFFDKEDESENATSTIAVLNFTVTNDATGELSASLVYEGWWSAYSNYPDLPNPLIKDKNNSNVDGFVFDHTPVVITVGGEE